MIGGPLLFYQHISFVSHSMLIIVNPRDSFITQREFRQGNLLYVQRDCQLCCNKQRKRI